MQRMHGQGRFLAKITSIANFFYIYTTIQQICKWKAIKLREKRSEAKRTKRDTGRKKQRKKDRLKPKKKLFCFPHSDSCLTTTMLTDKMCQWRTSSVYNFSQDYEEGETAPSALRAAWPADLSVLLRTLYLSYTFSRFSDHQVSAWCSPNLLRLQIHLPKQIRNIRSQYSDFF